MHSKHLQKVQICTQTTLLSSVAPEFNTAATLQTFWLVVFSWMYSRSVSILWVPFTTWMWKCFQFHNYIVLSSAVFYDLITPNSQQISNHDHSGFYWPLFFLKNNGSRFLPAFSMLDSSQPSFSSFWISDVFLCLIWHFIRHGCLRNEKLPIASVGVK